MSTAAGIISKGTMYNADPQAIVFRKDWNPRFDFGDMKELEASIKANGFRKNRPLLVKRNDKGYLEIVDGERRMTAVKNLMKAGVSFEEGVPVIIEDRHATDLDSLVNMFTANEGKPFLPLEEAAAFQRMKDAGLSIKEIHKRTGKSDTHITETLALLTADSSVKEAVAKKEVSATLAKKIATKAKGDSKTQKELVETAKQGKAGKKLAGEKADSIKKKVKSGQQAVEVRPISKSQLETRETLVSNKLAKQLKDLGLKEADIAPKCAASDELALAFHYGALMGLRAALGQNVKVTL